MRRFGGDNLMNMMGRLGLEEDQPIESRMVTRAIEKAQKRVEGYNFDIRSWLLQYDDVINQQREIIYKQRREVLERDNLRHVVEGMMKTWWSASWKVTPLHSEVPEEWDYQAIVDYANAHLSSMKAPSPWMRLK